MIKTEQIYTILKDIQTPNEGFNLRNIDGVFWGKGANCEIVFGLESADTQVMPMIQTTKHLKLYLNTVFNIDDGFRKVLKPMSVLILQTPDQKYVDIFVGLTTTFSHEATENGLLKYFLCLKELFSSERKTSHLELQGLYGELLVMYILQTDYCKNVAKYYQTEEKRKFDFSISETKKIEVKTTLKTNRVHHFLQEQLNTQRYDIRVVSIMLLKDDQGISLKSLIERCKELFSDNLYLAIHIERMIKGIDEDEFMDIRYNYEYSKANFKMFDANIIPRLHEKTADGVFNVEYDSDLTNTTAITIGELTNWIEE